MSTSSSPPFPFDRTRLASSLTKEERQALGGAVPDNARAALAYYQSLLCAGWAARVVCEQHPAATLGDVLNLGLPALREAAEGLAVHPPASFEAAALAKIKTALCGVYQNVELRLPEPVAAFSPEAVEPPARPLIMVADDSAAYRYVVIKELRKAGMDTCEATDGADVLLMAPIYRPDLILMDVQLERVDGVKVCELLRHTVLAGSPLVIFLSSHCEKEAILKGFEAGATDFITKNKPFDPREGLARIRAHLQIRQLQVQLEAANQQLQRANAAKDRILTVTTHDLRSPLTAVRGLTEYLRDGSMGPVTTKQLETLNYLSGSVEAMLILVNDLLDVTTLDVHQIKLECKPLDFVSLLRWVGWAYSPLAARKNLRLQLDIPESGLEIAGDEIRLKRVLENLVTNAIKFSPAGTQIILGARSMGDVVSVWVDDEGPGVPLDEQAKLFTEYGRTSSLPTGGESSTGLGLAICRRIVAAHGGVIIMRNRLKGGAHFEFCLPRVAKPSGVESRAA